MSNSSRTKSAYLKTYEDYLVAHGGSDITIMMKELNVSDKTEISIFKTVCIPAANILSFISDGITNTDMVVRIPIGDIFEIK